MPTAPADAGSSLSLVVRRTIRASAERLFAAWTRPAEVEAWWGPAAVRCPRAEIDLRVGGRYRIANELPDGQLLYIVGEYTLIEPPHRLAYTWRREPGPALSEFVTVRFIPRNGATEVTVVHERIIDAAIKTRHEQGWHGCFEGLAAYLAPSQGESAPHASSSSA